MSHRALGQQWGVRPMEGLNSNGFEAHLEGQRIGELFVSPSKHDGLVVNNIKVEPEHRRKGVAGSLYEAASHAHGGAPIDHMPSTMTTAAKKAVKNLSESQPGVHRRVVRDRNGNSRARAW